MPTITVPATDRRVYIQVTHPFTDSVPNASGVATVAGGDFVPCISISATEEAGVLSSAAMTSGNARTQGIPGRRNGRWSGQFPFRPSGAAGTLPDIAPILEALVGQAGTVVPSTSVTYAFSATAVISSMTIWVFSANETGVQHRCIRGAIVDSFQVQTSDGELVLTVSGPCAGVFDSVNFSTYETNGDVGNLTAFPAEPGSPASLGGILAGFLGSVTLDGAADSESTFGIEQFGVDLKLNRELIHAFGKRVARIPNNADRRNVDFSLGIFEQNTSNVNAVRLKPYTGTTSTVALRFGETVGARATFNFNRVVWPPEVLDSANNRSVVRYNGARAHASGPAANDEMTIVLT